MKSIFDVKLDKYLCQADQISRDLLDENGALIQALRKFQDYFLETLWRDEKSEEIPTLLGQNALMLYLAGIRIALSGHPGAMYPVLRTSLESACYAYRISEDPSLTQVWTNRHKGEEERKTSINKFNSAVQKTAKSINSLKEKAGDTVLELYQHSIDYGAHPNFKSFLHNLTVHKGKNGENDSMTLHVLHSHDSQETRKGLLACLDFGFAIALILTCSLRDKDQEHQKGLFELNSIKESVYRELFTPDQ